MPDFRVYSTPSARPETGRQVTTEVWLFPAQDERPNPQQIRMEIPMPDKDLDEKVERMLNAALGGLTPHEALVKASLDEAANVDERAAAKEKNRERALRLLAELDKAQGKSES